MGYLRQGPISLIAVLVEIFLGTIIIISKKNIPGTIGRFVNKVPHQEKGFFYRNNRDTWFW
ncbi:TPA: hypothetical protein DDZ75_03635 [Patescibacteria group bacterium]|nr:hypothetical protein [Patescibacteria group bacterium]